MLARWPQYREKEDPLHADIATLPEVESPTLYPSLNLGKAEMHPPRREQFVSFIINSIGQLFFSQDDTVDCTQYFEFRQRRK